MSFCYSSIVAGGVLQELELDVVIVDVPVLVNVGTGSRYLVAGTVLG